MTIAKTNRREYPPGETLDGLVFTKEQRKGNFFDLIRTRKMLHITVSVFFISLTATVVYLAVTITSPSLGGNMYLNVFIMGIIEIPANFICMVVIKRLGRRKVIAISLIVAATGAVLVILLTRYDPGSYQGFAIGRVSTSALAKMAVSVAYITVTMFASECYPSVIRGTGFAVSNAGVDIGGIITPFIIKLDHISPLIPYGFIAGAALLSGILCLTLKETGDKPTRETLNDKDWTESCLADTTEGEFSDEIRETDV
ncbi:solute carrier family 22 member 15 [Exaiptasia diaphana]|nr:solute carrier family 22 member 15 [Exaiptasia diaphana]